MHNIKIGDIKKRAKDFSFYIHKSIFNTSEDKNLLKILLADGDVFLFGGIIRDFFFADMCNPDIHRDIDLVTTKFSSQSMDCISRFLIKRNSLDGFKLLINEKEYDIWPLENTWALKNFPSLSNNIKNNPLPHTSFFSITAIIFSLQKNKFIFHPKFVESLNKRVLDIVFKPNPFPALCIVKTFEYYQKYNLALSQDLKNFVFTSFETSKDDLERTQQIHYGNVRFSYNLLEEFYNNILNDNS